MKFENDRVGYGRDDDKAASNVAKHRISLPEATTVLLDPLAMTFADPDRSLGEMRFVTIGNSESKSCASSPLSRALHPSGRSSIM